MAKRQAALQAPEVEKPAPAAVDEIILYPTTLKHIFQVDLEDDGVIKEVAVVKRWENGSISYIDVGLMDEVDRRRMVSMVKGLHADKYELYDVMFMTTLSNGMNGLEYFNQLVKHKLVKGSMALGRSNSLATMREGSNRIVGSEFSDPSSGKLDA